MKKYKKNSFKYAAYQVLASSSTPMSPSEIVRKAIEKGILDTDGMTPEATLGAVLYVDIRDNKNSDFIQAEKGKFTLREMSQIDSPVILAREQNEKVKHQLLKKLMEMDPFQFEYLVAELLGAIGFENVNVTKRSGDKGIDVNADLVMGGVTNVKTVVQAKRYKEGNSVPGATVTQMRGSAEVDQRGLIITTSTFTKAAVEESEASNKMPVSLIDGKKLVDLLIKNEIGVKKQNVTIYTLNQEFFDDDDIAETVETNKDKYKSIWPLPGGDQSYITTLELMLEVIGDNGISLSEMNQWFLNTFESVSSAQTINGYINVPKLMGLISKENNKLFLTNAGNNYNSSKSKNELFKIINDNILAFGDIVEFLESSDEPQSATKINEYITDNFDVSWTTPTQVTYRLIWLINLGLVEKIGSAYKAV
jgi:HJR/Mrr/RecB family endonuclease